MADLPPLKRREGPDAPGLPPVRRPVRGEKWICRECKYNNNPAEEKRCAHCGRDWEGNP